MADAFPIIAIATGDPAGIGPEISMKAALDPGVRALCRPVLFGEPTVVARHAKACGIGAAIRMIDRPEDLGDDADAITLVACPSAEVGDIGFGAGALDLVFPGTGVRRTGASGVFPF